MFGTAAIRIRGVLQGATIGAAIIDDEADEADPAASGPYITL